MTALVYAAVWALTSLASLTNTGAVAHQLNMELGATTNSLELSIYFEQCDIAALLSAITHVQTALGDVQGPGWRAFAQRAFKEENVAYTVDEKCGVHPAYDDEFDTSRQATIAALDKPRYAAARKFFDEAIADLKQPRDTRDAVRKTFEALENVAKLMCPDIERLGATEVKKYLQPIALDGTVGAERDARGRMIESFAEWVNGCQKYRHAAGQPEPVEPSLELAILMVSQGASWLRWLLTLDQAITR